MENLNFRKKKWMTNWGFFISIDEISNEHLINIAKWINRKPIHFIDFVNNDIGHLEWIEIFQNEINYRIENNIII